MPNFTAGVLDDDPVAGLNPRQTRQPLRNYHFEEFPFNYGNSPRALDQLVSTRIERGQKNKLTVLASQWAFQLQRFSHVLHLPPNKTAGREHSDKEH